MKLLFLDDYRSPEDCIKYMYNKIGRDNIIYDSPDWFIVRHYPAFVEYITNNGLPDLISFDHDLADGHYHNSLQEGKINYAITDFDDEYNRTGYHCAQFLVEYCAITRQKLPNFIVHSMNPVGSENIQKLLENYKKYNE